MSIEIKTYTGRDIEPYLNDLARLRIAIFRDFPYLYDGSIEYEENYLRRYTESPDSLAVLVSEGGQIVGASTAIPMEDENEAFRRPFIEQGYNPSGIFYCGESVLSKEYRGRGIYASFFTEREKYARKLKRFNIICFCAADRPHTHPLKPAGYQPLDPVWNKFGYEKHPELTTTYSWKDLDREEETKKEMVFWLKKL